MSYMSLDPRLEPLPHGLIVQIFSVLQKHVSGANLKRKKLKIIILK